MMKTNEKDLEMAKYIWTILKSRLNIIQSWGLDPRTVLVIKNGIQFHVQGFILTGNVLVVYNEGTDYFDVTFHKDDVPEEVESYNGIAFDELVDFIDSKVEKTEDHKKRICQEYGLNTDKIAV